MSSGRWGRVLSAHMRKGFIRVSQHGVDSAGHSLSRFVGFAGLEVFLFDFPLLFLVGIASLCLALLLVYLPGAVWFW